MAFLAKLVPQVLRDQRERKATKVHLDPTDLPDLLYVVQPFVCLSSEGENPVTMVTTTKVYMFITIASFCCRDPKVLRECVETKDLLVHL